ncbi:MAG: squalene/phytoene synthase family protein [Rhodobacteraceae bacterium]|nr:squalene/phytoene synthase family protein [Paracoccaceae bacterium]
MTDPIRLDADTATCAGLVHRSDPDRFRAIMAAPPAARAVLFPLYAFNLEVARAPWVTKETMIAEMRLQWWRDAIDEIANGGRVRRHEVVCPLARFLPPDLAPVLDTLIVMRRWDIYTDPFEDQDHFDAYIDATSGGLFWVAGHVLGDADEQAMRDVGWAAGVANWLRAVPELEARKRIPLVDGTDEGLHQLAGRARDRLRAARAARDRIPRAAALAGWQTESILRAVRRDPRRVRQGVLVHSTAMQRFSLMWQAGTGRW